MERTLSVEEKIRRAEAIYEKRQGNTRPLATIKVGQREKKDLIDENIRLKQQVRNARSKLDVLRSAAPTEVSNADLLRRLSNLEKIIYGETSKYYLGKRCIFIM